jgi:hypothetical protein
MRRRPYLAIFEKIVVGEFGIHVEVFTEYGNDIRSDFIIKVGNGWQTLNTEQQVVLDSIVYYILDILFTFSVIILYANFVIVVGGWRHQILSLHCT